MPDYVPYRKLLTARTGVGLAEQQQGGKQPSEGVLGGHIISVLTPSNAAPRTGRLCWYNIRCRVRRMRRPVRPAPLRHRPDWLL